MVTPRAHDEGRRVRRGVPGWALGLLALVALVGLYLGISGYAIAASASVSNPEALGHWRRVAAIYTILAAMSLIVLVMTVFLGAWRLYRVPPSDRSGAV